MPMSRSEEVITSMGLAPWVADGQWRLTSLVLGPESARAGSSRPLTGVLFAWLDVVTGSPPSGAMNPTVDLQVRLFEPPRLGTVHLRARTLRLGRTLYVGEVELRREPDRPPFGLAVATFMNQPVPFPDRPDPAARGARRAGLPGGYDRLSGLRRIGPGVLELDAEIETPQGTVGGATLGRLAEEAALSVFEGAALDELDLRFLHRVRVGPLRTSTSVLGERDGASTVRVEVLDAGDGDRLVTYALAVCRPDGST